MPGALVEGRGNAERSVVPESDPFAMRVAAQAFGEVLRLAQESGQEAVDNEMVDLRDLAVDFDPQVVDHGMFVG